MKREFLNCTYRNSCLISWSANSVANPQRAEELGRLIKLTKWLCAIMSDKNIGLIPSSVTGKGIVTTMDSTANPW